MGRKKNGTPREELQTQRICFYITKAEEEALVNLISKHKAKSLNQLLHTIITDFIELNKFESYLREIYKMTNLEADEKGETLCLTSPSNT